MISWFWVTGSISRGFKVKTKKPSGRGIREPHESRDAADRWIAMQYINQDPIGHKAKGIL